jgi:hypothetical protein
MTQRPPTEKGRGPLVAPHLTLLRSADRHKKLASDAKEMEREAAADASEIALQESGDVKEHLVRQKQARRQSVHRRREYAKLQVRFL